MSISGRASDSQCLDDLYTTAETLGAGGFGAVLKATSKADGRQVRLPKVEREMFRFLPV